MRSIPSVVLGLLITANIGCVDLYTATVPCFKCDVPVPVEGSQECTKEAAEQSAKDNCTGQGGVPGNATYETEMVLANACPDQRQDSVPDQLLPTLETAAVFDSARSIARKRRITPADGPSCPNSISFTMEVVNNGPENLDPVWVTANWSPYEGAPSTYDWNPLSNGATVIITGVGESEVKPNGGTPYLKDMLVEFAIGDDHSYNIYTGRLLLYEGETTRLTILADGSVETVSFPSSGAAAGKPAISGEARNQPALKPIPDPKFARGR